jgi:two-component system OmpR family response regulator
MSDADTQPSHLTRPAPTLRQRQADAKPLNAFLVEDNENIRDAIVEVMPEMMPVQFVGITADESSARLWLRANEGCWDIAIVDLLLLQGTGFGVVAECRRRSDLQKVVVLSSTVDEAVRQRCLDLGANAVFDRNNDIGKLVNYCRAHAAYLAFRHDTDIARPPTGTEVLP